jgi:hypothetical protein
MKKVDKYEPGFFSPRIEFTWFSFLKSSALVNVRAEAGSFVVSTATLTYFLVALNVASSHTKLMEDRVNKFKKSLTIKLDAKSIV